MAECSVVTAFQRLGVGRSLRWAAFFQMMIYAAISPVSGCVLARFFGCLRTGLACCKTLASKQPELIIGEAVHGTPLDRFRFSWSVCAWPRGPKVLGEVDPRLADARLHDHIPACARVLRTHTVANSCAAPRANHRGGPAVTQHHRVRRKCRVAASAPPYAAAAEPINTATEQDARR